MSQKIEFVDRATAKGANVSALCREFSIARETGYKWLRRFRAHGYDGLEEGSRRPKEAPLATAEDVVVAIVEARSKHPSWGPIKLATLLKRTLGDDVPAPRTIARVLKRFGQIRKRPARRVLNLVERAPEVVAKASNDVWTIDFKGWWRTLDGSRCDPLTVRDAFSRYVLCVSILETNSASVRAELGRLFRKHGVPKAIQCDNGSPFISVQSRAGLTTLSAWWVSLGIQIVRSRPSSPQDNGGHERMHRDLAIDVESRPATNTAMQQRACDKWRQEFNHVRPHDALGGRVPAEVYKPIVTAPRVMPPPYAENWIVRRVKRNGVLSVNSSVTFLSTALRGYQVALQPLGGLRHRVWFYGLELGDIELEPSSRVLGDMPKLWRPQRSPQVVSLPPRPPRIAD